MWCAAWCSGHVLIRTKNDGKVKQCGTDRRGSLFSEAFNNKINSKGVKRGHSRLLIFFIKIFSALYSAFRALKGAKITLIRLPLKLNLERILMFPVLGLIAV